MNCVHTQFEDIMTYRLVSAVTIYQSTQHMILEDLNLHQQVTFHHVIVTHHSRIFELMFFHLSNITFSSYEIQIRSINFL
jgi:hypothetical protein